MKTRQEKNKKIRKEITREEHQKKIRIIVKIISIILITIFSFLSYGMFIGAKVTYVKEYKVTNSKVPSSFHGIKIVHLSDILYDSLNSKDLSKIEKKVNNLEADILVFTGDIKKKDYELKKEDITLLENFFKSLNSSIKKYAVIGDNDNETFKVIMENSNFEIISNKHQVLYYKENEPINIVGIDSSDINLSNITLDNNYSICIIHNPDKIDEVLKSINCDLSLAGDNLGGEIKIPFYKGILTNNKYYKDYYELNNTELYISNGLGSNNNIRLFNHPSISLYRLTKY